MNAFTNTTIPAALWGHVVAWFLRMLNGLRDPDEGVAMTEETTKKSLARALGRDPTFGVFAELNGRDLLGLVERIGGAVVPANVAPIVEAFARAFGPETPRCSVCGLPGLTPRRSPAGVHAHAEGETCPHKPCEGELVVEAGAPLTITAWTTLEELPGDVTVDTTSEKPSEIPIGDALLRKRIHATTLTLLDAAKVPAWRWAAWLRHGGGASRLGGVASTFGVLDLLAEDVATKRGGNVLASAIKQAAGAALGGPFGEPSAPAASASTLPRVLLAYVPEDAGIAAALTTHLAPYRGTLALLDMGRMTPGVDRARTLAGWVANAAFVVVLVSADALADGQIQRDVIGPAQARGARVVPVLARPCSIASSTLGRLRHVPDRAISTYREQDDGLLIVAQGIGDLIRAQASESVNLRLTSAQIHEVYVAAIAVGFAGSRHALLSGMAPAFIAYLPGGSSPGATLLADLNACNEANLADGSSPIRQWLKNAARLAGPRRETAVFERYLGG